MLYSNTLWLKNKLHSLLYQVVYGVYRQSSTIPQNSTIKQSGQQPCTASPEEQSIMEYSIQFNRRYHVIVKLLYKPSEDVGFVVGTVLKEFDDHDILRVTFDYMSLSKYQGHRTTSAQFRQQLIGVTGDARTLRDLETLIVLVVLTSNFM